MNRILIVEDEVPIAQLIEMSLARAGYQCEAVNDGCAAADKIEQNDYDLVLLDIMLPGLDGYELLEYLRPMGTPVIFITAKGTLGDRVRGLNLGADDYIVKPFEVAELVARVESVLRRTGRGGALLRAWDVTVDTVARSATKAGVPVALTPREFDLLEQLLRNRGAVVLAGNFDDALNEAGQQAEVQHLLQCYALESDLLDVAARGETVTDSHLARYGSSLEDYVGGTLVAL